MEIELTLLVQSGLPKKFQVDVFLTSIFIINRLPTKVVDYSSPFEHPFHIPPDFTYFRAFGCHCFPYLLPYSTDKLSYCSTPCIFIGYCSNHKGFQYFDPSSRRVYISRYVIFEKGNFPVQVQSFFTDFANNVHPLGNSPNLLLSPPSNIFISSHTTAPSSSTISYNSTSPDHDLYSFTPISTSSHSDIPLASPVSSTLIRQLLSSHNREPSDHQDKTPPLPIPSSHMITKSQIGHLKPHSFPNFHLYYSTYHPFQALHVGVVISEPQTYAQIASIPEWHVAINSEFQALLKNDTWSLCFRSPSKNMVPCNGSSN